MTEDLVTVFRGSMTDVAVVETLLRDAGLLTHVEVADANLKHLMGHPSGDPFEFQIQVPKSQAGRAGTTINERKGFGEGPILTEDLVTVFHGSILRVSR